MLLFCSYAVPALLITPLWPFRPSFSLPFPNPLIEAIPFLALSLMATIVIASPSGQFPFLASLQGPITTECLLGPNPMALLIRFYCGRYRSWRLIETISSVTNSLTRFISWAMASIRCWMRPWYCLNSSRTSSMQLPTNCDSINQNSHQLAGFLKNFMWRDTRLIASFYAITGISLCNSRTLRACSNRLHLAPPFCSSRNSRNNSCMRFSTRCRSAKLKAGSGFSLR